MIQRKYETVVGIFVVASLAALLVMVLVIAQQERLWQEHVQYRAVFKNISGLKEGSEVRLAGVTVGNVKGITIDPQGRIIVTFEVLGKYSSRVRRDSRATIGYMGLLGDKSLDISTGSLDQPEIPKEGTVASIEPLDITEMLAKAQPSFENLQTVLSNLAILTRGLGEPDSEFNQAMKEIQQIISKIDRGKGSLGLIVNDPALYRELTRTVTATGKVAANISENKGLAGALISNPALKARGEQAMADMRDTFANLKQASAHVNEMAARLPEIAKKGEAFLEQLNRAGVKLPELVNSGAGLISDADKVAKGAQKSWFLRSYIPKPRERSIRVEREP